MLYAYEIVVECICSMGLMTNVLLLFVVMKCPLNTFALAKYYFILVSVQNFIMVTCYLILAPRVLVRDNSYVFLSTGLGSEWVVAPALILVYNAILISTLVYSMNSIIYRFIQLCRSQWFFIYGSPKYLALFTVFNVTVILNWVLMVYFTGWPDPNFIEAEQQFIMSYFNFKLGRHAFVTFSLKYLSEGDAVFLVESLILLLALMTVAFSCALRIHLYLRGNSVSSHTRKIQSAMFIILLLQTACPVILLYVPLLIMFLMLFTGWDLSPAMSFCCGILMSAYPLFSPIIIMFYMKDYRHYILHIFGLGKQAAAAARTMIVIAKDGKTTFTT